MENMSDKEIIVELVRKILALEKENEDLGMQLKMWHKESATRATPIGEAEF